MIAGRFGRLAPRLIPSSLALTATPDGGWADDLGSTQQAAQYYNGRTYFVYLNTQTGDVEIRYYDHTTGAVSPETVVRAGLSTDASHASPVLLVREPDHRIMVVYTTMAGAGLWGRVSTNPEDISSFSPEFDINVEAGLGGSEYTYPHIVQLNGEPGEPVYVFVETRVDAVTQTWGYTKHDGTSWSRLVEFFQEPSAYGYMSISKVSETRIDILATDRAHSQPPPGSLYHCYFEGGDFYRTNGQLIGGLFPFSTSLMSLVYDGTATSSTTQARQVMFGADGLPRALFRDYRGGGDHRWRWAAWNGEAWSSVELCDGGRDADDGRDTVAASACMDPVTPQVVYVSRDTGGINQIFRYTSDDGVTWRAMRLTNTVNGNVRPVPVHGSQGTPRVLWLNGESDPDPAFACGIRGW